MSVIIKEITSKEDRLKFVKFPFSLYKGNKYFVPPIIADELETLDDTKNPVFDHSKIWLFLAYENDEIVGRIAAIINDNEIKSGDSKLRFGWYDIIDNKEVSDKLLQKVESLAKENNLEHIEGPVGFSNLDKAGLLIEGFEERNTMVTLYNYPYYASFLENFGYEKCKDWIEYEVEVPEKLPEKVTKFSNIILKRYKLKVKLVHSKKQLRELSKGIFDLLDESYGSLSSYVPITQKQKDYYTKKFINFIHLDYVFTVVDETEKVVGFTIIMPSYQTALQKAKGKLFPFGWFYLLKAHYFNDRASAYLIGVSPKYQNKGVTAVLFNEIFRNFAEKGIKKLETNPELVDNASMQTLWNSYTHRKHKYRRSYIKYL